MKNASNIDKQRSETKSYYTLNPINKNIMFKCQHIPILEQGFVYLVMQNSTYFSGPKISIDCPIGAVY